MRHRVFITITDMWFAQVLIRLLYQHGIDAFWVTEEGGEKLTQYWVVDAWITAN